jgi:enoyl-CoA hydratase
MTTPLPVQTSNFRVEIDEQGVAHLVFQPEALDIARRLANGSRSALAGTKRSLNHWLHAAWPAFEASLGAEMMDFGQADAREGVAAIKEKRAPNFTSTASAS